MNAIFQLEFGQLCSLSEIISLTNGEHQSISRAKDLSQEYENRIFSNLSCYLKITHLKTITNPVLLNLWTDLINST